MASVLSMPCHEGMDLLKQQAQEMNPQKRWRGAQKLCGRTAALAFLLSLGWPGGLVTMAN
jgi:hypothetical protein